MIRPYARHSVLSYSDFRKNTRIAFANVVAPMGWIAGSENDIGIRIVSSAGAATGGTDAFSTAFSPTKTTEAHQLDLTEIPSHAHTIAHTHTVATESVGGGALNGMKSDAQTQGTHTTSATSTPNSGNSGGDGTHTHDITLDPQYIDMLLCTKQ
jgi:hypothetical protein